MVKLFIFVNIVMARFIIVPSISETKLIPTLDGGTIVLPESFVRDPLQDYLSWYSDIDIEKNLISIKKLDIKTKLLSNCQIEKWIEENCSKHVLAQHKNTSWIFVFLETIDKEKFKEWFFNYKVFEFSIKDSLDDIKVWLEENIKSNVIIKNNIIYFHNKSDAALFKMTWGDFISEARTPF